MHHPDWPLARIFEIRPSRDQVVRVVKVKAENEENVQPAGNMCLLKHSAIFSVATLRVSPRT